MPSERVNRFLSEFTDWCTARPDIVALALVGSYARGTATETSDVDLVVLTKQPYQYLKDTSWVQSFGQVEWQQTEDYGKLTSIRVWYKVEAIHESPTLEVEYGITDESWAALPLDKGTREVISGGMRVLFERGNILSRHLIGKEKTYSNRCT